MDTIQRLMSLAHDMSDAVHAMHGRGAVTHDADWLKARKDLETALRELLGEPVAWMKHHKGVPDKRTTFTDNPEAVARWAELGAPLEPLYALRHNVEMTGPQRLAAKPPSAVVAPCRLACYVFPKCFCCFLLSTE